MACQHKLLGQIAVSLIGYHPIQNILLAARALGLGGSIFNIDFLVSDDNGTLTGDVALSSQWLVPPPPVSSDSGVVPSWAEDLAWFGALATLVLIVVSVLIFTRKEQS